MGYVETLPSGRFRGIPWIAAAGKRGKSESFDHWWQADAYWRSAEDEMDRHYSAAGIEVSRQQRGIPLFGVHVVEWAKLGIEDGEKSTLRGYQSQARMLAKRWPDERVDEITELMIRAYLAELRDAGASPSTRTLRLTVLRHSMRAAVKAGYRSDDPTLGIKGPKKREHQPRILTDEELLVMLVSLPGWLWPSVLLAHDAGMRVSEVAGLRVCNLDLLRGVVTIVDIIDVDGKVRGYTKGKRRRDVPLSQRCLLALREHIRTYPPVGALGPVFARPRTRGRHLTPDSIRNHWDRALTLASLDGDKPTPHDLRHGCATALADAGTDPWVIQQILGHGSPVTTQRYVRPANLSRQADAVHRVFGAAAETGRPESATQAGA